MPEDEEVAELVDVMGSVGRSFLLRLVLDLRLLLLWWPEMLCNESKSLALVGSVCEEPSEGLTSGALVVDCGLLRILLLLLLLWFSGLMLLFPLLISSGAKRCL